MANRVAVVFGFSDQGEFLAKRLMISFIEVVSKNSGCSVDFYPYECNFTMTNSEQFEKAITFADNEFKNSYSYEPFIKNVKWDCLPEWKGDVITKNCIDQFSQHYLPDISIYHDFSQKYARQYDYVLYCHNDIIFTGGSLNEFIRILSPKTEYSIIVELRATANFDISLRFHMCFVFVNQDKFEQASLSFVNNYSLANYEDYQVYRNGGSNLLSSFYRKKTCPKWRPYLLDIHGSFLGEPGHEIFDSQQWLIHKRAVEWNRSQNRRPRYVAESYAEAREYVNDYLSTRK